VSWHLDQATIVAYGDGALDHARASSLEAHLLSCGGCRDMIAATSDRDRLESSDFVFLAARAAAPEEGIVSIDDHLRAVLLKWSATLDLQTIADRLGVSRKTLWEKKRKLGL